MKQEFNFDGFTKNVNAQITKAYKLVGEIEQMSYNHYDTSEEEDLTMQKLDDEIFKLRHKIIFALEFLELKTLLRRFNQEYEKYEDKPPFETIPYIDILHSPKLGLIWNFINVISCQFQGSEPNASQNTYKISLLERLLRGTGKLIADRQLLPKNEADVRKEVYQTLYAGS